MDKIKVILADDHQLFRDGIKSVLSAEQDIEVIAEANNGRELLQLINECSPQIVISDITMPDMSGIDACKEISSKYPCVKVLILSMHTNEEFIIEAIKSGAQGYLPKDTGRTDLLKAIRTLNDGNEFFSAEVSQTIIRNLMKQKDESPISTLTQRELEIIKLVAEGLLNKEIANKLCISIRTVDAHKNNIMNKLELRTNVDLVKFAIKHKLIEL